VNPQNKINIFSLSGLGEKVIQREAFFLQPPPGLPHTGEERTSPPPRMGRGWGGAGEGLRGVWLLHRDAKSLK